MTLMTPLESKNQWDSKEFRLIWQHTGVEETLWSQAGVGNTVEQITNYGLNRQSPNIMTYDHNVKHEWWLLQ